MKVNLIVFDFDGTLFDTKKDIAAAVNAALKEYGLSTIDEDLIWKHTGDGTEILIKRFFESNDVELFKKVAEFTVKYYTANFANFTVPVDHVLDFINALKVKKKVILSNKNYDIMMKILSKFNLVDKFDSIYGMDSFPINKPDPYPLLKIIEQYSTNNDKTIFIGDSINDILISNRANVRSFIIPSGVTPLNELNELKPFKIFYDYKEIKNMIE